VGALAVAAGAAIPAVLWWGDPQLGTASWLNPATISGAAVVALGFVTLKLSGRRSLAYLALVLGLLTCLAVFTAVGWFFRGPDWTLTHHPGPGHSVHTQRGAR
jgi:hypothetical protein